jgi:hypothetical protein
MSTSKRIQHTSSFLATDAAGKRYQLHAYTEYIDVATTGGRSEVAGAKKIRTDNGQKVNRHEKGKYQIAATGLELTSDDPNAP